MMRMNELDTDKILASPFVVGLFGAVVALKGCPGRATALKGCPGRVTARGEVTSGQRVFFRDDVIEGPAPNLPVEIIDV